MNEPFDWSQKAPDPPHCYLITGIQDAPQRFSFFRVQVQTSEPENVFAGSAMLGSNTSACPKVPEPWL